MFITPAFAQAATGTDANAFLMQVAPFGLVFVILYFLMVRPQQKKLKEHKELVANLRRGDSVITSGGLVGKVTKIVDDEHVEVEIADGVRVRHVRSMITGVRSKTEPVKDDKAAS